MNRRAFLAALAGAVAAPVMVSKVPASDAGISIRFIREWDIKADRVPYLDPYVDFQGGLRGGKATILEIQREYNRLRSAQLEQLEAAEYWYKPR